MHHCRAQGADESMRRKAGLSSDSGYKVLTARLKAIYVSTAERLRPGDNSGGDGDGDGTSKGSVRQCG